MFQTIRQKVETSLTYQAAHPPMPIEQQLSRQQDMQTKIANKHKKLGTYVFKCHSIYRVTQVIRI